MASWEGGPGNKDREGSSCETLRSRGWGFKGCLGLINRCCKNKMLSQGKKKLHLKVPWKCANAFPLLGKHFFHTEYKMSAWKYTCFFPYYPVFFLFFLTVDYGYVGINQVATRQKEKKVYTNTLLVPWNIFTKSRSR